MSSSELEVEALRQEIDQTRTELAATVQQLAGRLDVPARTRAAWSRRTEPVRRQARQVRQSRTAWLVLAGVSAAALVTTVLVIRGRLTVLVIRRRRK